MNMWERRRRINMKWNTWKIWKKYEISVSCDLRGEYTYLCMTSQVHGESCTVRYPGQGTNFTSQGPIIYLLIDAILFLF